MILSYSRNFTLSKREERHPGILGGVVGIVQYQLTSNACCEVIQDYKIHQRFKNQRHLGEPVYPVCLKNSSTSFGNPVDSASREKSACVFRLSVRINFLFTENVIMD